MCRYCDRTWNTENCYTIDLASECNVNGTLDGDYTYWKQNCTLKEDYCIVRQTFQLHFYNSLCIALSALEANLTRLVS